MLIPDPSSLEPFRTAPAHLPAYRLHVPHAPVPQQVVVLNHHHLLLVIPRLCLLDPVPVSGTLEEEVGAREGEGEVVAEVGKMQTGGRRVKQEEGRGVFMRVKQEKVGGRRVVEVKGLRVKVEGAADNW